MATTPGRERPDSERGERFDRDGGTTARTRRVRRATTETKRSSRTSELYAYIAVTAGVLLAGLLTRAGDGADDRLTADKTWLLVAILTVGYMISRGLAKAGSRGPHDPDRR